MWLKCFIQNLKHNKWTSERKNNIYYYTGIFLTNGLCLIYRSLLQCLLGYLGWSQKSLSFCLLVTTLRLRGGRWWATIALLQPYCREVGHPDFGTIFQLRNQTARLTCLNGISIPMVQNKPKLSNTIRVPYKLGTSTIFLGQLAWFLASFSTPDIPPINLPMPTFSPTHLIFWECFSCQQHKVCILNVLCRLSAQNIICKHDSLVFCYQRCLVYFGC